MGYRGGLQEGMEGCIVDRYSEWALEHVETK